MGPAASVSSVSRPAEDVLVVASKVKSYIKDRADFNTSDKVMEVLTAKLKILCDEAIDKAREEGRKTVLDRDFE
ncbi:MAG: hypothetical protein A4S09_00710 [Proteobacteria bacterium SG_bin7]|nr:MAG: hypothetical protein A4S09_00710 [Proteobacteria bacterium SG_bin7]